MVSSQPNVESQLGELPKAPLSRLPSLTGLRFIAAFLVFVYHTSLQTPYLRLFGDKSFSNHYFTFARPTGGIGVAFFFILSGFILTWSARDKDTPVAFWRRRFVKIYPNHVLTWALTLVLFAAATTPVWKAVLNLFLLHTWVPDFQTQLSVDQPSWSLGAEVLFYLCFPFLLGLSRRIRVDRLKFWILGTIAGIVLTPLISYLVLPSRPLLTIGAVSEPQYYFAYILPLTRLLDFLLGILVARAVLSGRWWNIGMMWSGLLVVAGFVLAEYVPFLYGQRATCVVPLALLIAAAAIADSHGRFTPFQNPVMVWLGNISFAFYLVHFIVLRYTRILFGSQFFPTDVSMTLLIADLAMTIAISGLIYHWFEHPIVRRWSVSRKKRAPRPQPATPVLASK